MTNFRILVADDNHDISQLLQVRLGRLGHEVTQVHTGIQCLVEAIKHRPDLILLDLGLPGGNGFQVMEGLKALDSVKDIPVIVQTGMDTEDSYTRCMNVGAGAFLKKPYDKNDLYAAVQLALGKQSVETHV